MSQGGRTEWPDSLFCRSDADAGADQGSSKAQLKDQDPPAHAG